MYSIISPAYVRYIFFFIFGALVAFSHREGERQTGNQGRHEAKGHRPGVEPATAAVPSI